MLAAAIGFGAALVVCLSSSAKAQWLPDRDYTEGPGIRVGDLELHPGVALRGGYDSNVFRQEKNPTSSGIFAVTPHLNIQTLGRQRLSQGEDAAGASTSTPPKVAFGAGLAGTLFYFSEKRAPTNVELDTGANVSILPQRVAGFDLGIDYARSIRPFTAYTGSNSSNEYARNDIRPSATFRLQSRSGILRASAGYKPLIQIYESDPFKYLNSTQHQVNLGTSWKFLPFTELLYDGSYSRVDYSEPNTPSSVILLSNSDVYSSRLGLSGAITQRFAVRALLGYAVINNRLGTLDDKEDVIAEAVARFGSERGSIEGGYQRNLSVAALGGWMQQDRGYVKFSTLLARVLALNVSAGAAKVHYGRILGRDGNAIGVNRDTGADTVKREDIRVDVGAHAEYRVTNWLALLADFSTLLNYSDYRFEVQGALPYPAQFKTFQAFGGLRVHY